MRYYYGAEQIRQAEAPLLDSLPEGALMRRAAYGLAAVVAAELSQRAGVVAGRRVCAIVGSGDNGGDALWALTFLRRRGVSASAVLLNPDRAHREGLTAFRKVGGRVVSAVPDDTDLILDGVVGISGTGPLRPGAAEIAEQINAEGIPVIAVDIPSGVDVRTGAVDGQAFRAAVTVTFGGYKTVHALGDCGDLRLIDIGLDLPASNIRELESDDVAAGWPIPGPTDDKYTQGVTGVLAGSATYPGAAILCTGAAVAATSGMVRYAGTAAAEVVSHWPEAIATQSAQAAGRVQSWVIGPGYGTGEREAQTLRQVLSTELPILVDADALTILAEHRELADLVVSRQAPTVLTPHAGEFERLMGAPPGPDRIAAARSLAARLGATVLLKGNVTVIAQPEGAVFVNRALGSWAATAGSGDVLSGVIGALLAAGIPADRAAAMGALVHARAAAAAAADPGPAYAPISASRLLGHLRWAIADIG
ncbi:NAD(P)H-hydrate dehydratase [Mycobacterium sp. CBMA271]|uniref:NAD(P)H-hydrate dehydratase n=1 Tax=unclassified Mycobacteroides TaxID=2618759 RepID=UPI0013230AEE|nr:MULTISPECIES: NAD(P)H-hydrate dehydratase [unclassified Mycobacteroides]MUM18153.1 bifunctional ADP-dependent (S)-NAD(P)H-hydrate dehydratase/NAD(P)H-hydrate epimerase [Mycobacteroides sp. CBMA 326]MUM20739.1 NAD(P)H-hydrate dehydratase [Mycobacteroides sp. CBMA 271]